MTSSQHLRSIRFWLSLFIAGLVLSGVTAFPLEHETAWLAALLAARPVLPNGIILWIDRVHHALYYDSVHAPFLAYGTDWLAFAHLTLAVAFIGPLVDPVRNKWVVQFGLIACAGVLALALIAGPIRGIPFPWRLIDCSFGIFGAVPLLVALQQAARLEKSSSTV
jgi:hypothetical protein